MHTARQMHRFARIRHKARRTIGMIILIVSGIMTANLAKEANAMFIVSLHYVQPIEEVDRHLADHIAFLDEQYRDKKFIFSGRKNPRTGGIILANVATREELDAVLAKDPFYRNRVAEYDITEFQVTKHDERFGVFLAP